MPFFGLVWVASWVGCFFSSTQDLLNAPSHLPHGPLANSISLAARAPLSTTLNPPQTRFTALTTTANAAVASTAFNINALSVSQSASASGHTGSRVPTWLKTAGTFLLRPWNQSSSHEASVSKPPQSIQLASTGRESEVLSSNPLSVIQNLLWSLQTIAGVPQPGSSTMVTKVDLSSTSGSKAISNRAASSSDRCRPVGFENQSDRASQTVFQVRIKDLVIAETRSQQQSDRIARRLEKFLRMPQFDSSQVHPTLVNGTPAAAVGNRILFTVDPEIASANTCNSEQLAIEWTNNLRIALQEAPLPLVAAQEELHSLQATGERIQGLASWYGPYFHGRQTATGELFDQNKFTAAHPSLPFDTYLKVTNLDNGKSVIVRVNDRGPYFENRSLDLSREAARSLGSEERGVVQFEAEIMQPNASARRSRQEIARL